MESEYLIMICKGEYIEIMNERHQYSVVDWVTRLKHDYKMLLVMKPSIYETL